MEAGSVALGAYRKKYSSSRHILNAYRATPGTSMVLLEQQKMRQTVHKNKGFMLIMLPEYFECA
jgi:hypothetical protein